MPVVARARALVAAVSLTVLALTASPASAHDVLRDSSPRADARVSGPPSEVRLVFDDRVLPELSVVRVLGPGRRELSVGDPEVSGTIVTQRVTGAAAAGTYHVAYRVVSADGHPVEGTWSFAVTDAGTGGDDASDVASEGSAAPAAERSSSFPLGRLALGLALAAGVGSLVLRARVLRAQGRGASEVAR